MDLHVTVQHDHSVLLVSGAVDTTSVPRLRARILALLAQQQGDVLLDMRQAGPVSDHLAVALTAARVRAEDGHQYVVVIDDPDGATASGLRRKGLHTRIPVHSCPAEAVAGLREDRRARARRWTQDRPAAPDPRPGPADTAAGDGVGAPRPAR